jgi:hypothetical protein
LIADLEKIASAMPEPLPRRGKGRPSKPKNLHALIAYLAASWERATGLRFSQDWHCERGRRVPSTSAAGFVHDVVGLIDHGRLNEVPKMTERIVREHKVGSYMDLAFQHIRRRL